MADYEAQCILNTDCYIGESPVWSSAEEALYFVDIPKGALHRFQPNSGKHDTFTHPGALACIAPHKDGGFTAGTDKGFSHLILPDGDTGNRLRELDRFFVPDMEGKRMNDGCCDAAGRFLAGSMDSKSCPKGQLFALDADGSCSCLMDGLVVQNGLAFSPDGRTLYVSDSHVSVQKIWAFQYNQDTGTVSEKRLFVDMLDFPGRPDGGTVDTDGCYWCAANDAGMIHRFTPSGKLDLSVKVPTPKVSKAVFAGPSFHDLFITSICPPDEQFKSAHPLAGDLFTIELPYQGLPAGSFG